MFYAKVLLMKEICTPALVLNKEPLHDSDCRVTLFSRDLGKIYAKVKSGRRLTSKLAPHLEPLSLVTVRLVGKNGFQVTDALKFASLPLSQLKIARLLDAVLTEGGNDHKLWSALLGGKLGFTEVLALLGLDPKFASCENCGAAPEYFSAKSSSYSCRKCASGAAEFYVKGDYFELSV